MATIALGIVEKRYGVVAAASGMRLETGAGEFIVPARLARCGARTMSRGSRSDNSAGWRK